MTKRKGTKGQTTISPSLSLSLSLSLSIYIYIYILRRDLGNYEIWDGS
jgi:hypothetical protein